MHNKLPYSVPEGYFQNLSTRLSEIPAQHETRTPRSIVLRPYLAIAAVFAFAFLIGGIVLRQTVPQRCSDDEIVEYLIDSGTTLAYIEYTIQDY